MQQAHANFTAEDQWNLHHHGTSRTSCKTRQVTKMPVETVSQKELDPSGMFQPLSLKLKFVTANTTEEHQRILEPIIEITSICLK